MSFDEHRHCKVCGRVAKADSETCSKACAQERSRRLESRRNLVYLLYGSVALCVLLLIVSLHP